MDGERYYIRDATGEIRAVQSAMEWAVGFENQRRVASTHVRGTFISTIFLGLNHRFDPGPPVLWETMAFDVPLDELQWRYTSERAALRGHVRVMRQAERVNTVCGWTKWLFAGGKYNSRNGFRALFDRTKIGRAWFRYRMRQLTRRLQADRERRDGGVG